MKIKLSIKVEKDHLPILELELEIDTDEIDIVEKFVNLISTMNFSGDETFSVYVYAKDYPGKKPDSTFRMSFSFLGNEDEGNLYENFDQFLLEWIPTFRKSIEKFG